MTRKQVFAAIGLLTFLCAFGATLRLAVAESVGRMSRGPVAAGPLSVGNANGYQERAEREPARAADSLSAAVKLNPHNSAAWISLGLMAERAGNLGEAARCLLEAERVDRQYLPAWTAANFFFRQRDDAQFWRAARRAAAMSYDDPAPLIDLADHREPQAVAALERLGDRPRLERGYLHFLISRNRWTEAQEIAARLAARRDARDEELFLSLVDHLIQAEEGAAALDIWNRLDRVAALVPARRGALTNGDFEREPSGHGFDWRAMATGSETPEWAPARLRFRMTASSPEACVLLGQWVMLAPGEYRLHSRYRTEGLAAETGLYFTLLHSGIETKVGAVLAAVQQPGDLHGGRRIAVQQAGLYQLRLVYIRVPGTTHGEGYAEFSSVDLERL